MKTLVIILAETRACELTFNNIKTNLIDELHADLCICVGVTKDYDYNNEFYKLAKYKFLYDEPEDYADAYDFAYNKITNGRDDQLPWREFLKIKDQFLGGIKDQHHQHAGTAGILIFFRWYLQQKLIEHNIIEQYDRFVITRSDYLYTLPHPKLELLDINNIWVPNGEFYGGITDRHAILSKTNIHDYLNILEALVLESYDYYMKMMNHTEWNLEQVIKFHLTEKIRFDEIRFIPFVMYTIRPIDGKTRWSVGEFSKDHNYYIKYRDEYDLALYFKKAFNEVELDIDTFYKSLISDQNI